MQALPKDRRGPDQLAAQFIAPIGKLYQVEAKTRQDGADAAELGRRNASANLYSLLQTCQVNGIDGYRYPRTLFAPRLTTPCSAAPRA